MINVSGGRTSGYMLYHLLDACDGELPPDVVALFTNTGEEHDGTLAFLKEMGDRWNVPGKSVGFPVTDDKLLTLGCDQYVGIRADEPKRVARLRGRDFIELPLADLGVTKDDVLDFWASQPFDLHVPAGEGNCRLCFQKRRAELLNVVQASTDRGGVERWIAREERVGSVMRRGHPYQAIAERGRRQLTLFGVAAVPPNDDDDVDMRPCLCGD